MIQYWSVWSASVWSILSVISLSTFKGLFFWKFRPSPKPELRVTGEGEPRSRLWMHFTHLKGQATLSYWTNALNDAPSLQRVIQLESQTENLHFEGLEDHSKEYGKGGPRVILRRQKNTTKAGKKPQKTFTHTNIAQQSQRRKVRNTSLQAIWFPTRHQQGKWAGSWWAFGVEAQTHHLHWRSKQALFKSEHIWSLWMTWEWEVITWFKVWPSWLLGLWGLTFSPVNSPLALCSPGTKYTFNCTSPAYP